MSRIPRLNVGEHLCEYCILNFGSPTDERNFLRALNGLGAVNEFRRVCKRRARHIILYACHKCIRHGPFADKPDLATPTTLHRSHGEFSVVLVGIADGEKRRRVHQFSDATMQVVIVKTPRRPEWAHFNHCHRAVRMKDYRTGISVGGGQIREPLDVSTQPIVGRLHHKGINFQFEHCVSNKAPAALKLAMGNSGQYSFVG